jgi:hypothetical protein
VQEYRTFVEGLPPAPEATLDDATIAEGLRRLAGALGSSGRAGTDVLVDLRVSAEHVLLNPGAADTTASAVNALTAAEGAMGAGAVPAIRQLRRDAPLGEQSPALREVFQQSAKALSVP